MESTFKAEEKSDLESLPYYLLAICSVLPLAFCKLYENDNSNQCGSVMMKGNWIDENVFISSEYLTLKLLYLCE